MLKYVVLFAIVVGCFYVFRGFDNEGLNIHEYSILQSCEHRFRNAPNADQYIIIKKALETPHTVVAFPIKGKEAGYVVMLAQAEGDPKTKSLPEVDFVVTESAFEAVKARTKLSPEIEQFIAAHIK